MSDLNYNRRKVSRAHPNVTSPSFLLSARREILNEVMGDATKPAFASDSMGVSVFWLDRDYKQTSSKDADEVVGYYIPIEQDP